MPQNDSNTVCPFKTDLSNLIMHNTIVSIINPDFFYASFHCH
uniref:Uncharacterized protein n=1 Tax=Manihot esculenta TaxID=3983 RepID=A0A2C9URW5_MANES